ncbi:MAG: NUDIX hydrolase [Thermoleophilia bacterium]
MSDPLVRAGGGIVARETADGDLVVLIVHRPRYDDWTFPKGKAEPGEGDEDCAVREVEEETGVRCALGPELPEARYVDHLGRPKVVRYWAMRPVSGEAGARNEVDAVRWASPTDAAAALSYPRDGALLRAFLELVEAGEWP